MITKNFKALLAAVLHAKSTAKGAVPVKTYAGADTYMAPVFSSGKFPTSAAASVVFSTSGNGIYLGSGNTPATLDDYKLESQITSGLSASSPTYENGGDADGNPFSRYTFTLTNDTSSDIVVREIGYVQNLATAALNGSSSWSALCLLDRTVLSHPITVPANGTATLKYTLKTIMS